MLGRATGLCGIGDAAVLMRPAGEPVLRLWPVSRAVNSVRNRRGAAGPIDDPDAPPQSVAPAASGPS